VDARAGGGLGVLLTKERLEFATSPKPSVLEHLVSSKPAPVRRLPIGGEPQSDGGVHFRVWAPGCREVDVEIEGLDPVALQPETDGYFSLRSLPARTGMRYRLRLDQGEAALPDPASRFQPEGPHGPSEIVDPADFAWTDGAWRGRTREQLVIYEMHVGTFTPDGSWESASRELPALAELGITCLEIMPVAEFPGRFGWGYDGVNLFAPTRLYGRPMDFRRFVDRAHALGIAVILDVVYNHFGPDGNYLKLFSAAYFTDRYDNEWGEAINFDGPDSGPTREFFVANAGYWIDEYHLDGLRLDATQAIFDRSEDHIIAAVARQVRTAGRGRITFVVAENEPQHAKLVRPAERGGYGLDALWNDDFHHSAMVALTGHHEAYYSDYRGRPREFVAAAKHGFLYQGQRYQWQRNARGTPTFDLPAECFVVFLQNHDQIANSGTGERCHALTSPGRLRAMTAFFLLMPGIPMLFQGQEFGASSPFLSPDGKMVGFFANGELKKVSLDGGMVTTICKVRGGLGASWGLDNTIVSGQSLGPLWEVTASGGTPSELTALDTSRGETGHRLPQILPGGDAVLFTITYNWLPQWKDSQIAVYSRRTKARKVLITGGAGFGRSVVGAKLLGMRGELHPPPQLNGP